MAKLTFERATKTKAKLRMAFTGPAKSGKTYTALVLATALANGERIGLIDTENRSSEKYADIFDFDIMELENAHPESFIAGIDVFEKAGHAVVILDSLSHAWIGKRGVLELHDDATEKSRSKDSYISWRTITPLHQALIDKMQGANCHIIATMRSKMAYIRTTDEHGKTEIRKVGLAPVQRQGMEYEFDILAEMHHDHRIVIGDTRCPAVDGATQLKPDGAWFQPILDWLSDGSERPEKPRPPQRESMGQAEPEQVDSPEDEQRQSKNERAHWIKDERVRKRFWAWIDNMTLDNNEVHEALGVEHVGDYEGSMLEAKEQIIAYVNIKAKDPAGDEAPSEKERDASTD